ncbi:synaptic vesicle membrane protein VAT-1 homolog isoform X2 [Schistocerca serialis cubense]|uniref:synaptic vesicle membrane protein VAT-1 homolog isoform X2 n=1 Tax=Schistocerca serialis cubense TaxID=2023355 RepID=UPI00214F3AF2|nr:synaptic vesicle membrane protein VAT-1 homolog isoform X2 [Schistocerca serialis cubense]
MDLLPLQFTAPTVIPSTDITRPVPSVTLTAHGSISRIKVTEAPLQKDICDDHVEVEVHYCGLNFTDHYLRLGIIRNRLFPVIMGSECSGIVTRVGKAVTDLQAGQKVLCLQMQGGLFRHVVHVQRKYCFLLPEDIGLKDAVSLGLNFVVAHFCLYKFGCLANAEKVFMQSIAGGVGTALIQLAQTVDNVEVVGTASESKHEKLRSLGVKRVFRHDNYETEILQDYPEGVDIVVNTDGGSDFEKCLKILKPVGKLVLLGSNSTATYSKYTSWGLIRPKWDSGSVSSADVVSKNYCIAGVNIGIWLDLHPEAVQRSLNEIFKLYSSAKIQPCIHAVLPFENVAEGITQLCSRENFGKVILEVKQKAAETTAVEVQTAVEPQPTAVEEAKEADPEVQKEDCASPAEPTVVEPPHVEQAEETVAEDKTDVSAP